MTTPLRIDPPELSRPKGYAHGVVVPAGGRLLFVAGQIAWDRDEKIVSEELAAQFEQALANFMAVVRAAGGTADGLASMTVFVTDKAEYLAQVRPIGAAWRRQVGRVFPAMALVQVAALLEPGAKVEIQGVAAL
jgi:enamine deaminase RidA (YjgF/YER057c/UK114 family)